MTERTDSESTPGEVSGRMQESAEGEVGLTV